MEIELKYFLPSDFDTDKLFADSELKGSEIRKIQMQAKYFDTSDFELNRAGVTLRVRKENDDIIMTSKWKLGGKSGDGEKNFVPGLKRRGEVNVETENPDYQDAELLKGEECYQIVSAAAVKGFKCFITMDFVRLEKTVYVGEGNKTSCVVSVDKGKIMGERGWVPIWELEIELKEGNEEDIIVLGDTLKTKYGLIPAEKSKMARGLELIMEKGK